MQLWAFILVSMGIIIIPGPNVLVVVSTSLAYGRARGLQTVAGTSAAMLVQSVFASFQRGFLVSLTNPKTIIFFSAFLPQFTSSAEAYLPQIALLSAIFWALAVILDSGYALLAHRMSSLLRSRNLARYQHGLSALLYIGAGSALAATKNV